MSHERDAPRLDEIREAHELIRSRIFETPTVYSSTFSEASGAQVHLKLENLQRTGSFKARGATHKILKIKQEQPEAHLFAASAGNHAQGVARAASESGMRSTIVMPVDAPISKQEATRGYGGEVLLHGQSVSECIDHARELAASAGVLIHPFDDRDIILGQGSVGLEILEQVPDPDVVVVPIGGGGLISGIAAAMKGARPGMRVVGVQAAACDSALASRREGHVVKVTASRSIADGIAVKQLGELTFPIIQHLVDDIVTVSEEEIVASMLTLLERKRVLAEGAGVVPLAALLAGKVGQRAGQRVVLVVSGGNVDSSVVGKLINQGLMRTGRIWRCRILIVDRPGELARLLGVISGLRANVLHVLHDRYAHTVPMGTTRVTLEVETRGHPHIQQIEDALGKAGYGPEPAE